MSDTKKKLFLLVLTMIGGLCLITAIVFIQTSKLKKMLSIDASQSQEIFEYANLINYQVQKLESVISYAFLTKIKEDIDQTETTSKDLVKQIKENINLLNSDRFNVFFELEINYSKDNKIYQKSYKELVLDLNLRFKEIEERILQTLKIRKDFLSNSDLLEKKRLLLSKQFRSLEGFQNIDENGYKNISRSVLTVLSTLSVRDLNFSGRSIFDDAIKLFSAAPLKEDQKAKWDKLVELFNETYDLASKVGATTNDFELLDTEIQKEVLLIEAFSKFSLDLFKQGQSGAIKTAGSTGVYTLVFSVLIIFLCLVIGYITTQSLLNTIGRIVNLLGQAGSEVSSTGEHLKNTSGTLSNGATRSAASLEETVSSLTEISSMVSANTEKSIECARLTEEASGVVQQGQTQVKDLINSMHDLANSSIKIGEIATVIEDIAFQTNLLALNAAVEAARAGEQGKGFAVVADAVRSLAQRSAVAAKDISSITNEGLAKTQESVIKADKSDAALNKIVSSIEKLSVFSSEIADASKQQASGIEQVNRALNELDEVAQRNASSAEETAQSSTSLTNQAGTLIHLVKDLRELVGQNKKAG